MFRLTKIQLGDIQVTSYPVGKQPTLLSSKSHSTNIIFVSATLMAVAVSSIPQGLTDVVKSSNITHEASGNVSTLIRPVVCYSLPVKCKIIES